MDENVMCYGVRYKGHPGYGLIMVDKPEYAKDNAKEIAKAVRSGDIVEHIPLQAAKDGMLEYLSEKKQTSLALESP